ncbi:unnamed protein product [Gordionus sp. m RMFG-2023]|uniref:uncharacterized protein LOC135924789 isoform X1 n=1 Tax=Gordionus sp. m RMFG-2023 TaxID=3053472 RepID=UPI0030E4F03B
MNNLTVCIILILSPISLFKTLHSSPLSSDSAFIDPYKFRELFSHTYNSKRADDEDDDVDALYFGKKKRAFMILPQRTGKKEFKDYYGSTSKRAYVILPKSDYGEATFRSQQNEDGRNQHIQAGQLSDILLKLIESKSSDNSNGRRVRFGVK